MCNNQLQWITLSLKLGADVYASIFRREFIWFKTKSCELSGAGKQKSLKGTIKGLHMSLWAFFTSIDQKEVQGGNVLTASSPVKLFSSSHVTVLRSANLPSLKLFFKEKQRRKGECQQRKGLGGNTETGRHLLHDLLMLQTLPQIRLWFCFYFRGYAIQMAFIIHPTVHIQYSSLQHSLFFQCFGLIFRHVH